jgi:hypothetical protein
MLSSLENTAEVLKIYITFLLLALIGTPIAWVMWSECDVSAEVVTTGTSSSTETGISTPHDFVVDEDKLKTRESLLIVAIAVTSLLVALILIPLIFYSISPGRQRHPHKDLE